MEEKRHNVVRPFFERDTFKNGGYYRNKGCFCYKKDTLKYIIKISYLCAELNVIYRHHNTGRTPIGNKNVIGMPSS